jgi:protein tyrosine/serine phosphatase
MKPSVAVVLGILLALAVVLLPIGYRSLQSVEFRNFRVVEDGTLYRSGRMTPAGFARVCREKGIRTVVCLRDTKTDAGEVDDQDEVDYCRANGIVFLRFPLADWDPVNGVIPGDRNVTEFLRVMADPAVPKPVLVHCFAGIHRTGPLVAAYRMDHDGWTPAEAIEEMKAMGTVRTTFAANLLTYLENYRPRRPVGGGGPPR